MGTVDLSFAERRARLAAAFEEQSWPERIRGALVDAEKLDDMPEPTALVAGVLYLDSIAWLFGAPASCKSFVALDMAGCVGTGENWQGQGATRQGNVLYVVAEGVTGVRSRVRAWESASGLRMANVKFLPMAVQAAHGAAWDALIECAMELGPVFVVIDTQARVTAGLEENSAKDMGQFVQQVERLRAATGACVLIIHHTGRGGEHLRGSIALDGAASTLIKVTRLEDQIELECSKQKDAPEFPQVRLRLVPHGTSAVVSIANPFERSTMDSAVVRRMLGAWWDSFETDWVSVATLTDTTQTARATFFRHLKALEKSGLVSTSGDGIHKRYRLTRNPGVSPVSHESQPVSPDEASTSLMSLTVSHPFRGETVRLRLKPGERDWTSRAYDDDDGGEQD